MMEKVTQARHLNGRLVAPCSSNDINSSEQTNDHKFIITIHKKPFAVAKPLTHSCLIRKVRVTGRLFAENMKAAPLSLEVGRTSDLNLIMKSSCSSNDINSYGYGRS